MQEEIYALALQLCALEEDTLLQTLCDAAEQRLRAQLREGIRTESCRDAFVCAAAMLAVSYLPQSKTAGIQSFRVGDVSVTAGGTDAARRLRECARELMAPYTGSAAILLEV